LKLNQRESVSQGFYVLVPSVYVRFETEALYESNGNNSILAMSSVQERATFRNIPVFSHSNETVETIKDTFYE